MTLYCENYPFEERIICKVDKESWYIFQKNNNSHVCYELPCFWIESSVLKNEVFCYSSVSLGFSFALFLAYVRRYFRWESNQIVASKERKQSCIFAVILAVAVILRFKKKNDVWLKDVVMVLIKSFSTVIMCFENLRAEIYRGKIVSWILKWADIYDG